MSLVPGSRNKGGIELGLIVDEASSCSEAALGDAYGVPLDDIAE